MTELTSELEIRGLAPGPESVVQALGSAGGKAASMAVSAGWEPVGRGFYANDYTIGVTFRDPVDKAVFDASARQIVQGAMPTRPAFIFSAELNGMELVAA